MPFKFVTFLTFPQWEAFFQKRNPPTFNIFNISPVGNHFFVGRPFKCLTFLTIPLWEAIFQKRPPQKGGGSRPRKLLTFSTISPVGSNFFVGRPFEFLTFLTFPQWEARLCGYCPFFLGGGGSRPRKLLAFLTFLTFPQF